MKYFSDDIKRFSYMDQAWQAGLAKLQPTEAELNRGLELHRDAIALDTFGFLPRVWTDEAIKKHNQLIENHVGLREARMRSTWIQQTAAAEDATGPAGDALVTALQASGLSGMGQTVGAATIAGMNHLEADVAAMSGFVFNCNQFSDHLFQAHDTQSIKKGKEEGRFGIIWSANSPPVPGRMTDADDELFRIKIWHQLGFRMCHLTYNRRNTVADGGIEDGGLSAFGHEVIAEFNRVGLIVDVPHSSRRTVLEAAAASSRPIMCSHAGCSSVFEHHRNKSDEEIKAVADTGGLLGIVGLGSFLGDSANINTLLEHVMHAVNLVGADHVSIGTDRCSRDPDPDGLTHFPKGSFNTQWPGGWNTNESGKPSSDPDDALSLTWTNWPLFTVGLVKHGLPDDDIRKIIGLNFMRVLDANKI